MNVEALNHRKIWSENFKKKSGALKRFSEGFSVEINYHTQGSHCCGKNNCTTNLL